MAVPYLVPGLGIFVIEKEELEGLHTENKALRAEVAKWKDCEAEAVDRNDDLRAEVEDLTAKLVGVLHQSHRDECEVRRRAQEENHENLCKLVERDAEIKRLSQVIAHATRMDEVAHLIADWMACGTEDGLPHGHIDAYKELMERG